MAVLPADLIGQLFAHVQPGLVYRGAVDERVWASQVDVFEDAGVETGLLRALLRVELAVLVDKYGLARADVAQQSEAERIYGHRLRSHHVFGAGRRFVVADHGRTDTEGVAEGDHAVAGDHRDHGVGAAHPPVDVGDSPEDCRRVQAQLDRGLLELMRQDVDQYL